MNDYTTHVTSQLDAAACKKRPVTVKLKTELVCRGCGAAWAHTEKAIVAFCPHCGKRKDARDRTEQMRQYNRSDDRKAKLREWYAQPENRKARGARQRILQRKRLLFRISGSVTPQCMRCGCSDVRLLEVNHKNGGGRQEYLAQGGNRLIHEIVMGRRDSDDLELLCRPCNALHYLEMQYGPLPMTVVWTGGSADA